MMNVLSFLLSLGILETRFCTLSTPRIGDFIKQISAIMEKKWRLVGTKVEQEHRSGLRGRGNLGVRL